MIIHVNVKANSAKPHVETFGDGRYLVYVKSVPENNEANVEMIKLLSKELGVPPQSIQIKFGKTSHKKLVEIRF